MKTRALFYSISASVLFFAFPSCKKNDELIKNVEKQSTSNLYVSGCSEDYVTDYLLSHSYSEILLTFNNTCDTAVASTSFPYKTKVFLSNEKITGHQDDCSIYTADVTDYLISLDYKVYEVEWPSSCDTAIATTHNPYKTEVYLEGGGIIGYEDVSQ